LLLQRTAKFPPLLKISCVGLLAKSASFRPPFEAKANGHLLRRPVCRMFLRRAQTWKETTMVKHDAIIIGTGQAGPAPAGRLAGAGMDVAIIERKDFCGDCVNTGCIPTKTLVASAYAAHLARRAADYGVTINGAISVDMKAVKTRKDAVSGKSRRGLENYLKSLRGCTVYEDQARFLSTREVA